MNQVITLKNGLKFVVLSKIDYEEEKYLCLSSYDDNVNIIFTRIIDNDRIVPVEDGNLIVDLLEKVKKEIKL